MVYKEWDINYRCEIDRAMVKFFKDENLPVSLVHRGGIDNIFPHCSEYSFRDINYRHKSVLGKRRYLRTRNKWEKMFRDFSQSALAEYSTHFGKVHIDKVMKENGQLVA